jgi:hypothetical protein
VGSEGVDLPAICGRFLWFGGVEFGQIGTTLEPRQSSWSKSSSEAQRLNPGPQRLVEPQHDVEHRPVGSHPVHARLPQEVCRRKLRDRCGALTTSSRLSSNDSGTRPTPRQPMTRPSNDSSAGSKVDGSRRSLDPTGRTPLAVAGHLDDNRRLHSRRCRLRAVARAERPGLRPERSARTYERVPQTASLELQPYPSSATRLLALEDGRLHQSVR